MLSSREQNNLLYNHCPKASHDCIRVNKKGYLQKQVQKSVKKKTKQPRSDRPIARTRGAMLEGSQPSRSNSSQSLSSPQPPGGSGNPTTLSPYITEVLNIQSVFVGAGNPCGVKDAILLRDNAMQFEGMKDVPAWSTPPMILDNRGKSLYNPRTGERVCFCTEWIDKNGMPVVHLVDIDGKEQYLPDKDADFDSARLPPMLAKQVKETRAMNKQMVISAAINNPMIEIVAVEASKRMGKSTIGFVGTCEGAWDGTFKKIGLWASGEDNAIGILGDMFTDEISVKHTYPLFKGQGSAHQKVFFNNAIIKAFSNNAARTSGLDFDLCWIDEAHEVVVQHREVFDMIIMTMRAKPSIKLLITMNKGTGTYHNFKRTLEEEFGKEVVFYTIEDGDICHITEKADKKVRTLVKAVGGKDEVTRWLDNQAIPFGTFDAMSVINAFESYGAWMMSTPVPKYTVFSYDPSGADHNHGWDVWACNAEGTHFWQLAGGELRLGETLKDFKSGEKLTPQQLRVFMVDKAHKYLIKENPDTLFISESNMNGKEMKAEMVAYGYVAKNQNFASNTGKGVSRDRMCYIVRGVMDDNAMYYFSEILRNELSIYDPNNHKGVDEYKGNEADSTIHAIYRLCRMSRSPYLRKQKHHQQYQEIPQNE